MVFGQKRFTRPPGYIIERQGMEFYFKAYITLSNVWNSLHCLKLLVITSYQL